MLPLQGSQFNISRYASVMQTEYQCQQTVSSNSSLDHTIWKQHDVLKHHKVTGCGVLASRAWWISSCMQVRRERGNPGTLFRLSKSTTLYTPQRVVVGLGTPARPFRHFHALSCKHNTQSRLKMCLREEYSAVH